MAWNEEQRDAWKVSWNEGRKNLIIISSSKSIVQKFFIYLLLNTCHVSLQLQVFVFQRTKQETRWIGSTILDLILAISAAAAAARISLNSATAAAIKSESMWPDRSEFDEWVGEIRDMALVEMLVILEEGVLDVLMMGLERGAAMMGLYWFYKNSEKYKGEYISKFGAGYETILRSNLQYLERGLPSEIRLGNTRGKRMRWKNLSFTWRLMIRSHHHHGGSEAVDERRVWQLNHFYKTFWYVL